MIEWDQSERAVVAPPPHRVVGLAARCAQLGAAPEPAETVGPGKILLALGLIATALVLTFALMPVERRSSP